MVVPVNPAAVIVPGQGGATGTLTPSQAGAMGGGLDSGAQPLSDGTPQIRKYKKRFSSDILCAALWGVNLLIGTEKVRTRSVKALLPPPSPHTASLLFVQGLELLDRSGYGKVYPLITRRRFQQMEVLEGQNILVTISGPKNRVRVYYLSWLKGKILKSDGVSCGRVRVGSYGADSPISASAFFRTIRRTDGSMWARICRALFISR